MKKRIGIVGGGASGVLTAIQCWRKLGSGADLRVFEPAPSLGRGKAYGGEDAENILNVPAGKMSAYPDRPEDFAQWIARQHPEAQESRHWPFVPRRYFGDYLGSQLDGIPEGSLVHVRAKVVSVSAGYREYRLQLEDGAVHEVDYLVLATGYGQDLVPRLASYASRLRDRIVPAAAVEKLNPGRFSGHVLILGSGLTALDSWRRLRKDPKLTFTFLSRRGLLPEPHGAPGSASVELPTLAGMSPLQIFQVLRCIHRSQGGSWALIADQVRTQAQRIWSCWTDKEKARFVRHMKPYWEVIRHRMPKSVADELARDVSEGRVRILSGRVQELIEAADHLNVGYAPPRASSPQRLQAEWIILATGSSIGQELLERSSIPGVRGCPHGFGYINESAPRVWIAGPPSKSVYWEITAVPDIREQAASIAAEIAKDASPNAPLRVSRISTHPGSVGESYFAHLRASASFGLRMWKLGGCAIVHALLPFLHLDTASSSLRNLAPVLSKRRQRVSAPQA
jgi:uncharacterized NAD(P)/FAD-binding protein YdhS